MLTCEVCQSECRPRHRLHTAPRHEIHERFDEVSEYLVPLKDGRDSGCFITKSYDATSHFQTVVSDIKSVYARMTGEEMKINTGGDEGAAAAK